MAPALEDNLSQLNKHIVSVSEGHDLDFCKASPEVRIAFATDQPNLTLLASNIIRWLLYTLKLHN